MKKLFLLLIPVMAVMLFASCKKDYVCTCVTKDNGAVKSTAVHNVTDTKKNANKKCTETGSTGGPGTTLTVTCTMSDPY
jgi:hypothetical protein